MVFRLGHIVSDHAPGRNLRCAVHSALCLGVDLDYCWRWLELTRSSKTLSTSLLAKRRRWGTPSRDAGVRRGERTAGLFIVQLSRYFAHFCANPLFNRLLSPGKYR